MIADGRMHLQKRNNITVHGDDAGRPTMVLAHGFGCDQSMWRHLVPAFRDQFRIVLFDLVGSGGSDLSAYNKTKYSTLQGYADDLLEIVEQYSTGPVVFVGHSVSSMICLLYTSPSPRDRQKSRMPSSA